MSSRDFVADEVLARACHEIVRLIIEGELDPAAPDGFERMLRSPRLSNAVESLGNAMLRHCGVEVPGDGHE